MGWCELLFSFWFGETHADCVDMVKTLEKNFGVDLRAGNPNPACFMWVR